MEQQQLAVQEHNGFLYTETCHLYHNRHRKLTISRMVKETNLPWNFVANFAQREQKNNDKIITLRNYLLRYIEKPELI